MMGENNQVRLRGHKLSIWQFHHPSHPKRWKDLGRIAKEKTVDSLPAEQVKMVRRFFEKCETTVWWAKMVEILETMVWWAQMVEIRKIVSP